MEDMQVLDSRVFDQSINEDDQVSVVDGLAVIVVSA